MSFQWLTQLGSERRFYHFCGAMVPWCLGLAALFLSYGLIGGLLLAPPDYQQGEAFRIIYVHVPCAMGSLIIYAVMGFYAMIYLIWRIKVADLIAYCLAPIGAVMTLLALITGAIWGKPMWGTWWTWDARLTSELILLFLYLGYLGLYQAINDPKMAAKAGALIAVVGLIDLPIIHYSVNWWTTLHQGSTLLSPGAPAMAKVMLYPLLSMIVGFALFTAGLCAIKLRAEILKRGGNHKWVKVLAQKQQWINHGIL